MRSYGINKYLSSERQGYGSYKQHENEAVHACDYEDNNKIKAYRGRNYLKISWDEAKSESKPGSPIT